MKRDIKFRAFNKVTGVMCHWDMTLGFQGTDKVFGSIEQFTGLQDKNGVDIYEGDKYKTSFGTVYTVFFVQGAFVGGKSIENTDPIGWESDFGDEDLVESVFHKNIRVVGNIHQEIK